MIWLILVIITVFVDAMRIFIDNYVSDVYFKGRGAASQKILYGYMLVIFSAVLVAINGVEDLLNNPVLAGILILAGFINGFSGIFYYKALEIDDSTNLGIFIQMAPVMYLVLGWIFLKESFSPLQLVAFAIVMAAPVLIVCSTRKRSRKVQMRAVVFSFFYVLIAVISNMIFVTANDGFGNMMVSIGLVLLGKGLADIAIVLARPKWHRRFWSVVKTSKRRVLVPMCVNFVVGTSKEFFYRMALVLAPSMAIASAASDSSEPIVIFFMGLVLTMIWPIFGREKLNRKSVMVHLTATVLVVIGVVLLQI